MCAPLIPTVRPTAHAAAREISVAAFHERREVCSIGVIASRNLAIRTQSTHHTDVVLVGAGIMSATLAVVLKELEPTLTSGS